MKKMFKLLCLSFIVIIAISTKKHTHVGNTALLNLVRIIMPLKANLPFRA